jgi:hypothetical protein
MIRFLDVIFSLIYHFDSKYDNGKKKLLVINNMTTKEMSEENPILRAVAQLV